MTKRTSPSEENFHEPHRKKRRTLTPENEKEFDEGSESNNHLSSASTELPQANVKIYDAAALKSSISSPPPTIPSNTSIITLPKTPVLEKVFSDSYLPTIGKYIIGNEAEGGLSRRDVRSLGACSRSLRRSLYADWNVPIIFHGHPCDDADGRIPCKVPLRLQDTLHRCQGYELGLQNASTKSHGHDFWICEPCANVSARTFDPGRKLQWVPLCRPCSLDYKSEHPDFEYHDPRQECNCDRKWAETRNLCRNCRYEVLDSIKKRCQNNARNFDLPPLKRIPSLGPVSDGILVYGIEAEMLCGCWCGKTPDEKHDTFSRKYVKHTRCAFDARDQVRICLNCLKPKWPKWVAILPEGLMRSNEYQRLAK